MKKKLLVLVAFVAMFALSLIACTAGEFKSHTVFTSEDGAGTKTFTMGIMKNDGDPNAGISPSDKPDFNDAGSVNYANWPTGEDGQSVFLITPEELLVYLNDLIAANERLSASGIELTLSDDDNFYYFSFDLDFNNMDDYNAQMRNIIGYNMTDAEWVNRNHLPASLTINNQTEEAVFMQDVAFRRRAFAWATTAIRYDQEIYDNVNAGLSTAGYDLPDSMVYDKTGETFELAIPGKEHYECKVHYKLSAYAESVSDTAITVGNDYAYTVNGLSSSGGAGQIRYRLLEADGETVIVDWTNTNTAGNRTFTGLSADTEYKLQARWNSVANFANGDANFTSELYTVKTNAANEQARPAVPVIESTDITEIVIKEIAGAEYKLYGRGGMTIVRDWQSSNVFADIEGGASYRAAVRLAATDTLLASPESPSLAVSTETKDGQAKPEDAPVISGKTATTVTVTAVDGAEYRLYASNGTTVIFNWQSSNVFSGLAPNSVYKVVIRYSETNALRASPESDATEVTTLKSVQEKPAAPVIASKTRSSITVTTVSGAEYKLLNADGSVAKDWQDSNEFTGLNAKTEYKVIIRLAETSIRYASDESDAVSVTTDKKGCGSSIASIAGAGWIAFLALGAFAAAVVLIGRRKAKQQ